jgi:murein L,D-transpeptidase YcbB/YkuD
MEIAVGHHSRQHAILFHPRTSQSRAGERKGDVFAGRGLATRFATCFVLALFYLPFAAAAETPSVGSDTVNSTPPPLPSSTSSPAPLPSGQTPPLGAAPAECSVPPPVGASAELSMPAPERPNQASRSSKGRRVKAASGDIKGGHVLTDDPFPSVTPKTAECTRLAAARYADIAAKGGWTSLAKPMKPDAHAPDIAMLRQRLAIEGDLQSPAANAGNDAAWDGALTHAVRHYQKRLGLRQSGIVDEATLDALNVPATDRAKALQASVDRLQIAQNLRFDGRHIIVNIPAAEVEAIEGDHIVHRYTAVVGGKDHQSPQIAAKATAIIVNPTWTLPASIIKNEVIPKMEKNPRYLSRMQIEVLDGHGRRVNPRAIDWSSNEATEYTLRQKAGRKNSLGTLKIDMPNKQQVYMHDTPAKSFFARDYRFLSHGCVRVDGVYDLAAWLLTGVKDKEGDAVDIAAIKDAVKEEDKRVIGIKPPVQVAWVYLDGWESPDGTVHFRDDIYGLDAPAGLPVSQAK